MRTGCCIASSMRSRSLMIGNERTEESRKDIRSKPGAPSPLAKSTTFCFQALRFGDKPTSSAWSPAFCLAQLYPERMRGNTSPLIIRALSLAEAVPASEQCLNRFNNYVIHAAQLVRRNHVRRQHVYDVPQGAQ